MSTRSSIAYTTDTADGRTLTAHVYREMTDDTIRVELSWELPCGDRFEVGARITEKMVGELAAQLGRYVGGAPEPEEKERE